MQKLPLGKKKKMLALSLLLDLDPYLTGSPSRETPRWPVYTFVSMEDRIPIPIIFLDPGSPLPVGWDIRR